MKKSKETNKEDKKVSSEARKKNSTRNVNSSEKVGKKSVRRSRKKVTESLDNLGSTKTENSKLLKREALRTSTLAKFLPNAVTLTAMCFGLSSIRFAQCNEWEYAVLCILVSALLDMFDGKIARFLDQSSSFGLELDSLSDLVCFGVAPSIVLYLSTMQQIGKIGWGICMFYTICCALRLARFNISRTDSDRISDLDRKYFVGIPAPAGAIVALFPLILFFEIESFTIVRPFYVAFFLMFAGCMMVSTIRTFSSKIIEINNTNSWVALTVIAFLIICLTTKLWRSLSVLIAFYLLIIPYGVHKYSEALKSEKTKE